MLIVIVALLVVGGFVIKTQSNLNLEAKDDRQEFAKQFGHWGKRLIENTKSATAYVVKMDWIPDTPRKDEAPKPPQNTTQTY